MFWTPAHLQFFLYRHPTDMRKSFDGLSGLVINHLQQDPLSGDVYVFLNRRKNRIKLLLRDGDGFWIFYKRLEKGSFQIPYDATEAPSLELAYESYEELAAKPDIIAVGCVAHVRRYFFAAQDSDHQRTEWMLFRFQGLYAVEQYC